MENKEVNIIEIKTKQLKGNQKILIVLLLIILVFFVVGIIFLFVNRIPSKYYGKYIRYFYYNGEQVKVTYKISPLSIKSIYDVSTKNKHKIKKENIKYFKKNKDLIIEEDKEQSYMIIKNDCLYINSSKDISFLEKYKMFYWKENSDNADIYEIENKAYEMKNLIEDTMENWTIKTVYETFGKEIEDDVFYISNSDEKTDKTDLNTYEIKYKVDDGDLTLIYNKKKKKLETITYYDSLETQKLYDSRAILMSLMYILGNTNNIELNTNEKYTKNKDKYLKDLSYRTDVLYENYKLFSNKKEDDIFGDVYSLKNKKYDIEYTNDFDSFGTITFKIELK